MIKLWNNKALCTLLLALASFSGIAAEEAKVWHTVAKDNFGKDQQRVIKASGKWAVNQNLVPLSVCGKDDSARSMIFDKKALQIEYQGLQKEAEYRLRLTFLSDHPGRAMAVLIDGKLVRERFNLPEKKIHRLDIKVARGMIADGRLVVTLENRKGPNAILSHAELVSTVPGLQAMIKADFFANGRHISGHLSDINAPDGKALSGNEVTAEIPGEKIKTVIDRDGNFALDLPSSWLENEQLKITLYATGNTGSITFRAARLKEKGYRKVVLERGCKDPFEIAVAKDGRIFYIERLGAVRMCLPQQQSSKKIAQVPVYHKLDDGLLGLALDPDFTDNNWMYLCYSILGKSENVVSRFTLKDGELDMNSEKIILRIPVQRNTPPCHTGGSLAFDGKGNLLISTGDNVNPFQSNGYSPSDERKGREQWDAQGTSADTNDLRGKILRITPQKDGTYTIPKGNLFAPGTAKTRPEIFVMGCRNPFRIGIDQKTGTVYWGEVGPDAGKTVKNRGPAGFDEFNQAKKAGNYGWPHFVADNKAYRRYDFATKKSGDTWVAEKPMNLSRNNKGLQQLPPAQPAFISYPGATSAQFPQLGSGGRCVMGGPVYHYNPELNSKLKLGKELDKHVFFYDWMRNWIMTVQLDEKENLKSVKRFMPNSSFKRPMDLELGPEGALYLIEWGSNYGGSNKNAQIVRLQPGIKLSDESEVQQQRDPEAEILVKFKGSLHGGNAAKGEAFYKAPKAGCVYCHRIGNTGGIIGPDLSNIGKELTRQQLLEAVILPSKRVVAKYLPLIVKMKDGKTYSGTAAEDTEKELKLNSPDAGLITLKKSAIKEIIKGQSPMPAGMGQAMTTEEMRDLIEFMSRLKK